MAAEAAGAAEAMVGRRRAPWATDGSRDRGARISAVADDRCKTRAKRHSWAVEMAPLAAATPQVRAAVCIRQDRSDARCRQAGAGPMWVVAVPARRALAAAAQLVAVHVHILCIRAHTHPVHLYTLRIQSRGLVKLCKQPTIRDARTAGTAVPRWPLLRRCPRAPSTD